MAGADDGPRVSVKRTKVTSFTILLLVGGVIHGSNVFVSFPSI